MDNKYLKAFIRLAYLLFYPVADAVKDFHAAVIKRRDWVDMIRGGLNSSLTITGLIAGGVLFYTVADYQNWLIDFIGSAFINIPNALENITGFYISVAGLGMISDVFFQEMFKVVISKIYGNHQFYITKQEKNTLINKRIAEGYDPAEAAGFIDDVIKDCLNKILSHADEMTKFYQSAFKRLKKGDYFYYLKLEETFMNQQKVIQQELEEAKQGFAILRDIEAMLNMPEVKAKKRSKILLEIESDEELDLELGSEPTKQPEWRPCFQNIKALHHAVRHSQESEIDNEHAALRQLKHQLEGHYVGCRKLQRKIKI